VALALGGRALLNFIDVIFPDEGFWDNALFYYVFPILLLAGTIFCLLRFREADMEVKETVTADDKKGLYWAFAIFIAYFALEGYTGFMGNPNYGNATLMEGFGKLIAVVVFVFVLLRLKKSVWHIFNAFFGISIVLALLSGFTDSPALLAPTHLLLGVWEIGWIAALYMLACAQRRFASYKLLKQCTVVFVILSPITTLSDEMVSMFFKEHIAVVTLVYAIVIALAFLMMSPYTQKYLFGAKWLDDLQKRDMELIYAKIEEIGRFEQFKLSDREKEVLALLLSTNTIRQVSAHLSIAQGTANTYVNRLYKKVGVNNRMELFQKFGVTPPDEKDD
jgi:DNA-binding CsgD family transcriptional regulator